MKRTLLIFASLIAALLILFQISKYNLITGDFKLEFVIAIIAIVFFFVGIFINKQYKGSAEGAIDEIEPDLVKLEKLEISRREYEVLKLISEGLSNKEIGERLFLSESTIKTHVSSLLIKLNAKRRTQAIQRAKEERIL